MMDCSQSSRRLGRFNTVCFLHHNKCIFICIVNIDNDCNRYYSKIEFGPMCFHVGDVSLNMKKREQLNKSCWLLVIRDVGELEFIPAGDSGLHFSSTYKQSFFQFFQHLIASVKLHIYRNTNCCDYIFTFYHNDIQCIML